MIDTNKIKKLSKELQERLETLEKNNKKNITKTFKSFLNENKNTNIDNISIRNSFIRFSDNISKIFETKLSKYFDLNQEYRFKGSDETAENLKIYRHIILDSKDKYIVLENKNKYYKIYGSKNILKQILNKVKIPKGGMYNIREYCDLIAIQWVVDGNSIENFTSEFLLKKIKKEKPEYLKYVDYEFFRDAKNTASVITQLNFSNSKPIFYTNGDNILDPLKNKLKEIKGPMWRDWNPGDIWGITKKFLKELSKTDFKNITTESQFNLWFLDMCNNNIVFPISLKKTKKNTKATLKYVIPKSLDIDINNFNITSFYSSLKTARIHSDKVVIWLDNGLAVNGNVKLKPAPVKGIGDAWASGTILQTKGNPFIKFLDNAKGPTVYRRSRAIGKIENVPNPISKSLFGKYQNLLKNSSCELRNMNINEGEGKYSYKNLFNMDIMKREIFNMGNLEFEELNERGRMMFLTMASYVLMIDNNKQEILKLALEQSLGGHYKTPHWKIF